MKSYSYRDLSVAELPHALLITACDSSGGVGDKPGDVLSVPSKYVAIFATRVCLFEVLACGGQVIGLSNTVANEMQPTGKAMIAGINDELRRAGIKDLVINGSTEENFRTCMTGLGIFVIAMADSLRITPSTCGDLVICIGKPKSGANLVLENDGEIASYDDLAILINHPEVNEIIPCGSKGILYEGKQLATIYQLDFQVVANNLNMIDSCGPATTLIASIKPSALAELELIFKDKLKLIGVLK